MGAADASMLPICCRCIDPGQRHVAALKLLHAQCQPEQPPCQLRYLLPDQQHLAVFPGPAKHPASRACPASIACQPPRSLVAAVLADLVAEPHNAAGVEAPPRAVAHCPREAAQPEWYHGCCCCLLLLLLALGACGQAAAGGSSGGEGGLEQAIARGK